MRNLKILLTITFIGLVLMSFSIGDTTNIGMLKNSTLPKQLLVTATDDIVGKWVNLKGCTNADNEQAYFQFDVNGTGKIYNVDCRNTCSGYGYYLYFDWSVAAGSVTLNYTSVSKYCKVQPPTPKPEDKAFTINGNKLSLGGATWTRK